MSYYQLRLTLEPSGNCTYERAHRILFSFRKWLLSKTDSPEDFSSSCGYELLNKYGEPCDPHFHFNFYYDHPTAINVERERVRVSFFFKKF